MYKKVLIFLLKQVVHHT